MKTRSIMNVWVAALMMVMLAGCTEKPIDYTKVEPEFKMKAKRLYTDFSKNAELASQKYLDKIIQIDGPLSRMEPAGDSAIILIYNYSPDDTEAGIRVMMLPEMTEQSKTLSKRFPIHIKGLCTNYDGTFVTIEKGSLAK